MSFPVGDINLVCETEPQESPIAWEIPDKSKRAWGSAHAHLDKTGISESASNTQSKVRKEEET